MAEKKQTTAEKPGTQVKEPDTETTADKPAEGTGAPSAGGGEYVVIADQVPVKSGEGKDATFTTYKRGDKVKLTAAQAVKLAGGTRPAVVDAGHVQDGNVTLAAHRVWRKAAEERAKRRQRR